MSAKKNIPLLPDVPAESLERFERAVDQALSWQSATPDKPKSGHARSRKSKAQHAVPTPIGAPEKPAAKRK